MFQDDQSRFARFCLFP